MSEPKIGTIIRSRKHWLPKPTIIIPIIFYILFYELTRLAARSDQVLMIGKGVLPITATAGAFSALSNICLVFLVLHYKSRDSSSRS